jgi:hypothetical protein
MERMVFGTRSPHRCRQTTLILSSQLQLVRRFQLLLPPLPVLRCYGRLLRHEEEAGGARCPRARLCSMVVAPRVLAFAVHVFVPAACYSHMQSQAAGPLAFKPRASTKPMHLKCLYFWHRLLHGCPRSSPSTTRMTITCMLCAHLRTALAPLAVRVPHFVSLARSFSAMMGSTSNSALVRRRRC